MLISLLMTGSTDSAIANQLGINVRSVRRWIAELMDELDVTTRLQLGAALVRADVLRGGVADPAGAAAAARAAVAAEPTVTRTRIQPASRAGLTRENSYARGSRRNRGRSPGGGDREGPRGKTLPDYVGLSARQVLTSPVEPPGSSGIPASLRKIWCLLRARLTGPLVA